MIVIAGDRGLAGGYNSNVFKSVLPLLREGPVCVLPIGKRTVEFFARNDVEMLTTEFAEAASVSVADCFTISNLVTQGYLSGQYRRGFRRLYALCIHADADACSGFAPAA